MSQSVSTLLRSGAFVLGIMLVAPPATQAQTPPRVLKNAVVQLVTGDDGKDDTDVFTVTVANAEGKLLERVFDAKEEIKPGTAFNLWLTRLRAAPAEQIIGSKVTFTINTKWDEHWVIKEARLTVNYEQGPPDRWHWGPFALQIKGAGSMSVDYLLDDAHKL